MASICIGLAMADNILAVDCSHGQGIHWAIIQGHIIARRRRRIHSCILALAIIVLRHLRAIHHIAPVLQHVLGVLRVILNDVLIVKAFKLEDLVIVLRFTMASAIITLSPLERIATTLGGFHAALPRWAGGPYGFTHAVSALLGMTQGGWVLPPVPERMITSRAAITGEPVGLKVVQPQVDVTDDDVAGFQLLLHRNRRVPCKYFSNFRFSYTAYKASISPPLAPSCSTVCWQALVEGPWCEATCPGCGTRTRGSRGDNPGTRLSPIAVQA